MNTFMYEVCIPFSDKYPWGVLNEIRAAALRNWIQDVFKTEQKIMTVREVLIEFGDLNPSPTLGLVGWDPKKDKDICIQYELMENGIILRITARLLL